MVEFKLFKADNFVAKYAQVNVYLTNNKSFMPSKSVAVDVKIIIQFVNLFKATTTSVLLTV